MNFSFSKESNKNHTSKKHETSWSFKSQRPAWRPTAEPLLASHLGFQFGYECLPKQVRNPRGFKTQWDSIKKVDAETCLAQGFSRMKTRSPLLFRHLSRAVSFSEALGDAETALGGWCLQGNQEKRWQSFRQRRGLSWSSISKAASVIWAWVVSSTLICPCGMSGNMLQIVTQEKKNGLYAWKCKIGFL